MRYQLKYLLCCCTSLISAIAPTFLIAQPSNIWHNPFYVGLDAGYGSTTWGGLVPSNDHQNDAMSMSTPKYVQEGGVVWGFFVGYEFIPYFALEANYMRYPTAKVAFDPYSLYTFEHDGYTDLNTHTETASLMGKIMLVIPGTNIRAYSSAGAAIIHRWDQMNDHRQGTPTFGLGANYNFTDHIMTEFSISYTAGYGESELNPAQDYMPFLYSAFLRLAYRF